MRRTLSTALQRASIVGLLCLLTIGCRGCGPGPAGANCNPDNSDSCEEGLVCAADSEGDDICQIPLGAECDPEDEEEFCLGEAECFAGEGEDELDGRCLAPRGVTCGADDECAPGLVCAETTGEEAKCFEQLVIRGQVFDSTTEDAIGGAFAKVDVTNSDDIVNAVEMAKRRRHERRALLEGSARCTLASAPRRVPPARVKQECRHRIEGSCASCSGARAW